MKLNRFREASSEAEALVTILWRLAGVVARKIAMEAGSSSHMGAILATWDLEDALSSVQLCWTNGGEVGSRGPSLVRREHTM